MDEDAAAFGAGRTTAPELLARQRVRWREAKSNDDLWELVSFAVGDDVAGMHRRVEQLLEERRAG